MTRSEREKQLQQINIERNGQTRLLSILHERRKMTEGAVVPVSTSLIQAILHEEFREIKVLGGSACSVWIPSASPFSVSDVCCDPEGALPSERVAEIATQFASGQIVGRLRDSAIEWKLE